MRVYSSREHFYSPWYQVTAATFRKYPNPFSPHVIAVDTLDRHVTPEGILVTERLLTCKQSVPALLRRWFGSKQDDSDVAYALEISELDLNKRTYTARSVNLNFRHLMKVDEEIVFEEDPTDVYHTKMSQRVEVTALGSMAKVGKLVEDSLVGRYQSNASNGKRGLEHVLDILFKESRAPAEAA
ncbi:PRELI-like family-domain-containing protein [Hyaloraphidium curvatum]|nr:PRELI-like family-domain-containing protein [Hyaloraphidium curvatum]